MSFAIIDQGRKVQTPLRTLYPDKGVSQTSASETTHSGTHNQKDLQSTNNEFLKIMERTQAARDETTPSTYEDLKPHTPAPQKKTSLMAAQIMSTPVHGISEGTTAHAAWDRMQELNISHLMVTNELQKPVGILSAKDIMSLGQDSTQSITNYYSKKLIAAAPHTDTIQLAACFLEYNINAIPIFDDEDIVGIVCRSDLLRLMISSAHIEGWA